jgi:putative ABC transport system permease protein
MIVLSKDTALTDLMLGQLGYYTQDEFMNIVSKVDDVDGNENPSLDKERFSYQELKEKEFIWYDNATVFGKKMTVPSSLSPTGTTLHSFSYNYNSSVFTEEQKEQGLKLKVVGILQPKDSINFGCLKSGIYYTSALSEYAIEKNYDSEIATHFREMAKTPDGSTSISAYTYDFNYEGTEYKGTAQVGKYNQMMSMFSGGTPVYQLTSRHLGGEKVANSIYIYPSDFDTKDLVNEYLDKWNSEEDIVVNGKTYTFEERVETKYTDTLSLVISMINTMIDVVTYALIAFTSLSLVVSCVMIAIITYVSVMERVKEIGVIRSLGGRKRDVSNLFNAETLVIGASSGLVGIGITYVISLIVNIIVQSLAGISIMILPIASAGIMVLLSTGLTVLSGLVPAKKAAHQDPVVALRTE